MKKIVIIVAGGSGKRMQAGMPKQFLLLGGKPLLMHAIGAFHAYDPGIRIILVLPGVYMNTWQDLCVQHRFTLPCEIRPGGKTRLESVWSGLKDLPEDSLIAVHDGVRPLVSQQVIARCFSTALSKGNAIPCVRIPESVRKISDKGNDSVDRDQYRLIQTPQVFKATQLLKGYQNITGDDITDDAGVVEKSGYRIHLVDGNPENIKITGPHDLLVAEALMSKVAHK